MLNFVHQKITEAVSLIELHLGILTKKQARCTVTWHAYNTDCSDKFQEEKFVTGSSGTLHDLFLLGNQIRFE
jgi:hypothetical protein